MVPSILYFFLAGLLFTGCIFVKVWKTSKTLFWPTLYLIDKNRNTSNEQIGAGQYEKTESAILRIAGRIIIIIRRKK